jgi:hypothetical protein
MKTAILLVEIQAQIPDDADINTLFVEGIKDNARFWDGRGKHLTEARYETHCTISSEEK